MAVGARLSVLAHAANRNTTTGRTDAALGAEC
jgi:hypothetical protein